MADSEHPPIDYAALAARYLELWQEQVAKLGQDPAAAATYMDAWSKMFGTAGVPNLFAGLMPNVAPPFGKDRTPPAAAAHGGGNLDHAALLRRLDAVERRLAALENPTAGDGAKSAAESSSPGARRKPKPRKA